MMICNCCSRFCCAIFSMILTTALAAQSNEDNYVLKVIPLQYVALSEVVDLVNQIQQALDVVTGSEATNSLIVRGEPEAVERIQQFVKQIDMPVEQRKDEVTEFVNVKSYPIDALVPLVEQAIGNVLGRESGRVAVDRFNNRLVVTAPKSQVEFARTFVTKLDQSRQVLTVHLLFIRGDIGGGTGVSENKLPESIRAVADALKENGFANPSLMAPFAIRAEPGSEFGTESTLQNRGATNARVETLNLSIKGLIRPMSDPDQVQLEISAKVGGLISGEQEPPQKPMFELETTLSVPIGRNVVLAVGPSSTLTGNAVAMVLRVTKD